MSNFSFLKEKRRYCKTLELSNTQKVLYTAGISQEIVQTREDCAFISAYYIGKKGRTLEQIGTILVDDTSHKLKKGFYRMSIMKGLNYKEYVDVLAVGSWLDLHIFALKEVSAKSDSFQHIYRYDRLHSSKYLNVLVLNQKYEANHHLGLLYSIVTRKTTLITCSDDCSISKIELY